MNTIIKKLGSYKKPTTIEGWVEKLDRLTKAYEYACSKRAADGKHQNTELAAIREAMRKAQKAKREQIRAEAEDIKIGAYDY
jgi:hypothetical protein